MKSEQEIRDQLYRMKKDQEECKIAMSSDIKYGILFSIKILEWVLGEEPE